MGVVFQLQEQLLCSICDHKDVFRNSIEGRLLGFWQCSDPNTYSLGSCIKILYGLNKK